MRLDLSLTVSRAEAEHDATCPDIGPICETKDVPPQQHHTTLWVTELRLLSELGLVPHLALQAVLPFRIINTKTRYTDLTGNPIELSYNDIHHRDEIITGLGDLQLQLHASKLVGPWHFGGRLGLSVPAGKVHENPYELGDRGLEHQHIQFGTGTVDPIVALDVTRDFQRWSLSTFGQTQVPLYEGGRGYQAGARILAGVSAASRLWLEQTTFRLGTALYHERAERWNGEIPSDDGNQGRTDLFVGPGMTIPFAGDWSVAIDVRARAWGQAVNAQLALPLVVDISIGRLFHFESGGHEEPPAQSARPADVVDLVHNGEAIPLAPVAGKWTVFDFWASWCEACHTLDKELRRLATQHGDLAIRRVNIVDLDSPIATQELRGVSQLPYIRIVDASGVTVWQGSGTPETLMKEVRGRLEPPHH